MDADDISMPNRLDLQMKYLIQYDYDLIGGLSNMVDEEGNTIYSIKKVPTDFKKIKNVSNIIKLSHTLLGLQKKKSLIH